MKKLLNGRIFFTCFLTMLILGIFLLCQATVLTVCAAQNSGEQDAAGDSEEETAESYTLQDGRASEITYGQLLQSSRIEGTVVTALGVTVDGTLSWKEPQQVMSAAGTVKETVVFLPDAVPAAEDGEGDTSTLEASDEPITFELSVTVKKAVPKVAAWPEIVISDTLYDGDKVSDKLSLKGGKAEYVLERIAEEQQGEADAGHENAGVDTGTGMPSVELINSSVAGSFQWELPDLELKTGKQALTLWFVPEDESSFERVKSRVWAEAVPRPVTISLEILEEQTSEEKQSGTRLCLGESASFEVLIPKSDVLTKINGNTYLWNSEEKTELSLTEGEEGWSAVIDWKPEAVGTYSFWAQYVPGDEATSQAESDSLEMTVYEPLVFAVSCEDVVYGAAPEPEILTECEQELNFSFRYVGTGETDYPESESAPMMPGTYRVTAAVEDHEDYAGQEQDADFTIKKADPVLELKADPEEVTGSQEVTLYITLKNPENPELKDGLPTQLTVSTDKAIKVKESLTGGEGEYTFCFITEDENETVRCTLRSEENDCYKAAESYVDVTVSKQEKNAETSSADEPESQEDSSEEGNSESTEPKVKTPEEVEADFWQDVIFRIYKAQEKGETVTINATGHGSMPDKVMEALRTHTKVTLALVWEGDMIVIPAGKALDYDKDYKNWTLGELSKRYPLVKNQNAQTAVTVPGQSSNSSAAASTDANTGTQSASAGTQSANAGTQSANAAGQSASAGSQSVSGTKNSESSTAAAANQNGQEDESGETECAETEEGSEEASLETENPPQDSDEITVPEKVIFSESTDENKIDRIMVIICACAGIGLIAILTAVISMVKKHRMEDEEEYLEDEEDYLEEEDFGEEDEA